MTNEKGEVCCQKYKSTQIDANKKGLRLLKVATGSLLLGLIEITRKNEIKF